MSSFLWERERERERPKLVTAAFALVNISYGVFWSVMKYEIQNKSWNIEMLPYIKISLLFWPAEIQINKLYNYDR